jgi:hypothetical protein
MYFILKFILEILWTIIHMYVCYVSTFILSFINFFLCLNIRNKWERERERERGRRNPKWNETYANELKKSLYHIMWRERESLSKTISNPLNCDVERWVEQKGLVYVCYVFLYSLKFLHAKNIILLTYWKSLELLFGCEKNLKLLKGVNIRCM